MPSQKRPNSLTSCYCLTLRQSGLLESSCFCIPESLALKHTCFRLIGLQPMLPLTKPTSVEVARLTGSQEVIMFITGARGFGRTVGTEGEQPFNLNILVCHLLYSRLGHRLKGNGLTEDLENPSSPIARRKKGLIPPGCVTA